MRQFYFSVAQQTEKGEGADNMATPDPSVVIAIESEEESTSMHELISDLLPLHWAVKGRQTNGKTPGCLVESLLKWLCANEQLVNDPIALTDLEIVFMLVAIVIFVFLFNWMALPHGF